MLFCLFSWLCFKCSAATCCPQLPDWAVALWVLSDYHELDNAEMGVCLFSFWLCWVFSGALAFL